MLAVHCIGKREDVQFVVESHGKILEEAGIEKHERGYIFWSGGGKIFERNDSYLTSAAVL